MRLRALRFVRVVGVIIAVGALAGCQVRVAVDTKVERDGRGVLTVGVGLDEDALAQVGDLDRQVRVGDLTAAGWTVEPAERGPDGFTWLRATKSFSSIDELNRTLAEVTGEPPVFRDFRLAEEDGGTATLHRLTGTVDAPKGMAVFADAQLGDRLGGDPVAAHVAAVEREEGRKLADLVTLQVTASVTDEATGTWHPRLDDAAPTRLDVAVRDPKPATSPGGGAPLGSMLLAGVVVVVMLAGARRRFCSGAGPVERRAPSWSQARPRLPGLTRVSTGLASERGAQLADAIRTEVRRRIAALAGPDAGPGGSGTNGSGTTHGRGVRRAGTTDPEGSDTPRSEAAGGSASVARTDEASSERRERRDEADRQAVSPAGDEAGR